MGTGVQEPASPCAWEESLILLTLGVGSVSEGEGGFPISFL